MRVNLRLSLRALRAFVATLENGSITGAAQQLNVPPSAVAAALNQVEAEFGADLLMRIRARGIAACWKNMPMSRIRVVNWRKP